VEQLNKNQRIIVKSFLKAGEFTVSELAGQLNVTPQPIRKDMPRLQDMGLVERKGAARATYYVLKEPVE